MGANATGKTSFGRFLMAVFNFMDTKQFEKITKVIDDTTQDAFLQWILLQMNMQCIGLPQEFLLE